MPNLNLNYFIFIYLLLLFGCAQQVSPTGGKKDTVSPKVTGEKPKNRSINFDQAKITLKFDENIQIKDPSQIVISPLLKEKPKIEALGNTVLIEFLVSKPEKNTTYTINFGNSIVDVNEGNILSDYSYVFSTGNILDSNTVSGIVSYAFNNRPEKDILIGLYKKTTFNDTTIYKNYPAYFGKSKETGEFNIQNLPNDTFILLAFKDANADSKYQKNEIVAFEANPIIAIEETNKLNIKLFEPFIKDDNTIIDSLSRYKGIYQFCVYRPKDITIKPVEIKDYYTNLSKGKDNIDTVNIYLPNMIDTSLVSFEVKYADTAYKSVLRTKNKSKFKDFVLTIDELSKPNDSIHIKSNLPIEKFTVDQLVLKQDSIVLKPKYFNALSHFEWVVYYPFQEGINYNFSIADSALKNIYGKYNKVTSTSIIKPNTKNFGNLLLSITNIPPIPFIFQIVEDSPEEKVIIEYTTKLSPTMEFNDLKPGNYKLKLIEDLNKNKVWDRGNLKKGIQAERVFYHNQVIIIKAYWDVEQTIDLNKIINN